MTDLRFQEVMTTFGIFYMDISLSNFFCAEIPQQDSLRLAHKFKTPFLPKSPSKKALSRSTLVSNQISKPFPWGKSISLKQLRELLNSCPSQFVNPPTFLHEEDMKHPDSAGIFCYFSKGIWSLASSYFHGNPGQMVDMDLASAMKLWTIAVLQNCCPNISFQPTFDGLEVEGKLPQTTFSNRRIHFFPPIEDSITSHPCAAFLTSETSYLSMYHTALQQCDSERINDDLDRILSLLQCVPDSSWERGKMVIWKASREGGLQFLVNSSLYRVKQVSAKSGYVKPIARAQLTQAMLKKKLKPTMWGKFAIWFLSLNMIIKGEEGGRLNLSKLKRQWQREDLSERFWHRNQNQKPVKTNRLSFLIRNYLLPFLSCCQPITKSDRRIYGIAACGILALDYRVHRWFFQLL